MTEQPRVSDPAARLPGQAADDAGPIAARGRILVIDDEPQIRKILGRVLGGAHSVVLVGSGREALAILDSDRAFDVILCDLSMPDISGAELHRRLIELDPGLARRVVFVTGGAFTPEAADFLARVDNVYIEKPISTADLLGVIADILGATNNDAHVP